jgi:type I restriction enzyme S subunit
MAAEWRERPLAEVTDNFDGIRVPVKEADRRAGPYPYYGASGVVDHVDNYLFDSEYLLIAEDGENLRTRNTPVAFLAREKFWVNNHAHIVRGNSEADTRFLMYALSSADISGYLTGSTMPKLTQGNLNRIPLLTPSLPEQRAIAHILGTLDDKIELNRRMNETLEAMARALFKSWFVDFDPVRAKAEGRDPGLPKPLADLFPDSFEDSELGEIPKGWEVGTLDRLTSIQGGKQLPTEECRPSGTYPVYGANGIMGYTEKTTHQGCVIAFGRVGAYCGSIHWVYRGAWINNNASAVEPTRWPEFVLESMLNIDFDTMRTGSAQPFITNNSLAAAPVLQPHAAVLDAYCANVRPLRLKQVAAKEQCWVLAALRDALLPKLISGKLRVPFQSDVAAKGPRHEKDQRT